MLDGDRRGLRRVGIIILILRWIYPRYIYITGVECTDEIGIYKNSLAKIQEVVESRFCNDIPGSSSYVVSFDPVYRMSAVQPGRPLRAGYENITI